MGNPLPGGARRHILCDAMTTLRRLIARALETATPTVEDIAAKLAMSSSALRRYRLGNRTPPPALVRRLVRLLHDQAQRLERLGAQLDHAVTKEEDAHGKE